MKFIFLTLCVLVCVAPANILAGEVLLPGEFGASFSESDPGFWLSSTSMNNLMDETFYSLTSFSSLFSANSDFLNDGQAEMYFEFSPLAFVGGIDEVGPSPIGSIQSARLFFEETVVIEAASWGHIKSLFGAF